MKESPLKAGSTVTYEIAGEKLTLTPMPWGKLKKALKLFSDSWSNFDPKSVEDQQKFMGWMMSTIEARMNDMFPLLVDTKINAFFTQDWVEENLTLQHIQQIITDAITINGVRDFLALAGRNTKPSPIEEPKPEEPVPA